MNLTVAQMAGWILATLFVVAGLAKLRDPESTAAEMRELRLRMPAVLARVIPLAELGTAAALILRPSIGGIVAVALLAAFTAVLVGVVRSGREVSCRCFGGLTDTPVSNWTLGRNGVLIVIGLIAALA